jgi:2,3-dihydroxybenzoate decarboxylase
MPTAKSRPPVRERIAVEEGFMVPEVAAAARALDEKLGLAGPVSESRKSMFRDLIDLGEGRLKQMDEDGITKQLIVIGSPGVQAFDPVQGHELSKLVNDRLAAACRAHPDRFAGLAAVAPQAPENAGRELERAVKSLGLKGAHINSHTHGEYLDDKKFWPIFERAEKLDVPIYLHPAVPHPQVMDVYYKDYAKDFPMVIRAAWGFTVETATTAIRLVLGGVFDKYPNLKIVLGHLGETLPFLVWRIDHALARPGSSRQMSFRDVFCHNFWITTSGNFSNPALLCCVMEMGIDRILFAIDWPFVPNPPGTRWMESVPLCDEDKAKILSGNAKKLFRM